MTIPSREELIQRLEETIQRLNETELSEHYIKPIREAAALLRDEEWIPVTERLPEESGHYLGTFSSGAGHTAEFYFNGEDFRIDGEYYNVIAWRPLPPAFQPKTGE